MAQYLKPDSLLGYIEDSAEIENLKTNNLRHSVLGCMLGDFNEVGAYVVSPEIVKELIEMEKYVVQVFDNIELCKSALKLDKQISFMVTFEGNRATLALVEKLNYEANFAINSGTYSDINEYVLDSVETSGEVNRNVLYARWNIKSMPSAIIDIFNCGEDILAKYFGIVERFQYLLNANTVLLEKEEAIEEVEAEYLNQIFTILSRHPKLEKEVLKTVKQSLSEKKNAVSANKPYFAKTLNEVVENAIQKNINVLEDAKQKEFLAEKRNAIVTMNIKREDLLEIEKVKTEDIDQISPAIPILKIAPVVKKQTINESAQALVKITNQVQRRIEGVSSAETANDLLQRTMQRAQNANVNNQPKEKIVVTPKPQRKKLETILNQHGIGSLVDVKQPPKKQEQTISSSPVVTPATKTAQPQKKKTAPVVKAGSSSSSSTKPPNNTKSQKLAKAAKEAPAGNVPVAPQQETSSTLNDIIKMYGYIPPVWMGGSDNNNKRGQHGSQDIRRINGNDLNDLIGREDVEKDQDIQRINGIDLNDVVGGTNVEKSQQLGKQDIQRIKGNDLKNLTGVLDQKLSAETLNGEISLTTQNQIKDSAQIVNKVIERSETSILINSNQGFEGLGPEDSADLTQ